MYDYLIVGAGLCGAVLAQRLKEKGKTILVLEKRNHIGGNIYTEEIEGIQVHRYGAHIFHTNDKTVWEYVCRFAEFNRFTNSPVANYHACSAFDLTWANHFRYRTALRLVCMPGKAGAAFTRFVYKTAHIIVRFN